jgi:hypothetical protein
MADIGYDPVYGAELEMCYWSGTFSGWNPRLDRMAGILQAQGSYFTVH